MDVIVNYPHNCHSIEKVRYKDQFYLYKRIGSVIETSKHLNNIEQGPRPTRFFEKRYCSFVPNKGVRGPPTQRWVRS
jgi:hypothetical protein